MTNENELIRRGDALAAMPNGWLGEPHRSNMAYGPSVVVKAKDAIRALPAVRPVRVKPLEWEPVESWKRCSKERAPAFGGEYQIVMLDPDDTHPLPSLYFEIGLGAFMFRFEQAQDPMGFTGETCPRKFPSVEAAKAAAQADYAARILAAIEPAPAPALTEALRLPEIAALVDAIIPLRAIADAFHANELDDEARKYWGENVNTKPPVKIELYQGRGGKVLLTLADAMNAHAALRALEGGE